ncbi:amidohydrolase [Clostridium polynesiense]|uniref:amidohydrolase n=1 Tax=Clostridium polynesiense TaxID=1325933 RepID=UPI00059000BD|nr:amidohydrolase [Clostridium polynesiense]
MKQELINSINLCSDEVFKLSDFLFHHPEISYKEYDACRNIVSFLKEKGFKVQENFLNISTAFQAEYGKGYPKICLICEYDGVEGYGHITGHNLLCGISLMSAVAIKSIVHKFQGSLTVLGCPGEYLGGAKVTMSKQGVFDDTDAVLLAHPDTETAESGTSYSILPLAVNYFGSSGLAFLSSGNYNALDAVLLTFNILNSIIKGLPEDITIQGILSKGGITPLIIPKESGGKFYIRAKNSSGASHAETMLKSIVSFVENLLKIKSEVSLYEPPYQELLTNITLSRLFSHNLKECGIIDINPPRDIYAGLSLGTVSHKAPCIHPYIGITEDNSIKYGTIDFGRATLSSFAKDKAVKAASALALTALDLIESENLLSEVKTEYFDMSREL